MEPAMLWSQYSVQPSPELKKLLILQYQKLVHYVIHNSKFIDFEILDDRDFFQFGIEGLSEAVDRFDPNYGTKFETYAIQRIRGKIIDELRKITIKPRVDDIDHQYVNISINSSIDEEEGHQLYEIIPNGLPNPGQLAEKSEAREFLNSAIQTLDERERLILSLYYYEDLSYAEIGKIMNITVSRVSQLHTRIISNLKTKMASLVEY